jgi:nicotinamide-nucleotide amidase
MFAADTLHLAENLIAECTKRSLKIATVESCTGGLIAGAITSISGSSQVLDRGYITYSNAAKTELVGVPAGYFVPGNVGAVSQETAREMAEGCLAHSYVDAAVAVTGIAGPKSDDTAKPVGLVYIAAARRGFATLWKKYNFTGDRDAVRTASVDAALRLLSELVAR